MSRPLTAAHDFRPDADTFACSLIKSVFLSFVNRFDIALTTHIEIRNRNNILFGIEI